VILTPVSWVLAKWLPGAYYSCTLKGQGWIIKRWLH